MSAKPPPREDAAPRTGRAPTLRLSGVRIRRDEREGWTPDGVDLTVAPGEVLLLLGPSGSGKSSLALALNGVVPHQVPADIEGTVAVAGLETAGTPVARLSEHVAVVFQDPDAQLVTETVHDEVCFGPENLLVPATEVERRAEDALTRVGLWHRRHDSPDHLSGGGKQRLAIASALAMHAPLLVLDEPTANLDPAGIAEVYAVLRSLVRGPEAERPAIVLVEHNLDAAVDLVDTVAVLDRAGRLALHGPARPTLRDNAEALHRMGVWLPVATLAALRLRGAGLRLDPLPLTPAELTAALDACDALPPPTGPGSPPGGAAAASPGPERRPPDDGRPGDSDGRTEAEPIIRVRGLDIERGERRLLEAVDLDVGRGDLLAVVGTNGAGKTTLVQALAGVVPPSPGRIRIGGIDPGRADARALARTVGFVFQNPEHQFVAASVFEELAHGLRVQARGLPRGRRPDEEEVEARVLEVLERFGLEHLRDEHPFLLSGGQKRRLSVGTALVTAPPVLVLDEPTFGQDRERAAGLLDLLTSVRADGTTVLIVTHDLQLAADYASHVAVLHAGRMLACDRTEAILADPATLQHAGLLLPPLAAALHRLERHEAWRGLTRLAQLPGARGGGAA